MFEREHREQSSSQFEIYRGRRHFQPVRIYPDLGFRRVDTRPAARLCPWALELAFEKFEMLARCRRGAFHSSGVPCVIVRAAVCPLKRVYKV